MEFISLKSSCGHIYSCVDTFTLYVFKQVGFKSINILTSENFIVPKYKAAVTVYFPFVTGIDFKIKTVELQGKKIKLQIW